MIYGSWPSLSVFLNFLKDTEERFGALVGVAASARVNLSGFDEVYVSTVAFPWHSVGE
jgi:hypothetical protein